MALMIANRRHSFGTWFDIFTANNRLPKFCLSPLFSGITQERNTGMYECRDVRQKGEGKGIVTLTAIRHPNLENLLFFFLWSQI